MRKAYKLPSEWLRLLCKQWAEENELLVDSTDAKFMDYKPFLKGMLTSQLLCRLSIPSTKDSGLDPCQQQIDFWRILGIEDEFDKAYIIAQIERFCSHYNIRGLPLDEDPLFSGEYAGADASPLAVPPGSGIGPIPSYMDHGTTVAATPGGLGDMSKLTKKHAADVTRVHRLAKDAEKAMEMERRYNVKREHRRVVQERKEQKARERESHAIRKEQERTAKEVNREERKRKRVEIREQREKHVKEQKEAALRRAAELVSSNRVPIEITRGAAAAKAAANAALAAEGSLPVQPEEGKHSMPTD